MFCAEGEAMAEKLAASGSEDEVRTEAGWRTGTVQWYKVHGQPHAFDVFPVKVPEEKHRRKAAVKGLYGTLSEWLEEVFSEGL